MEMITLLKSQLLKIYLRVEFFLAPFSLFPFQCFISSYNSFFVVNVLRIREFTKVYPFLEFFYLLALGFISFKLLNGIFPKERVSSTSMLP